MKILYVKNNSERSKEFQLKTIIYEENGQKFVKKQALCQEAIPHLKSMKDGYSKITDSIVNTNIKLAKIIGETKDSLTFEFIEGISLEERLNDALKVGEDEVDTIIVEYTELLKEGFKTTLFDSATMVSDKFIKMFGDQDYSLLNGGLCYEGVSNIDLIFSNIIFKDNYIYIIDYEWGLKLNIPIEYVIYRGGGHKNDLYEKMEEYFISTVVMGENSFYLIQHHYLHNRLNFKTDFIKGDTATLYIDTGSGFNEVEKVTAVFDCNTDKSINFSLESKFHNVKAIRIDPLEMPLSIKVKNISVNTDEITNDIQHNGINESDEQIKFLHNDPQLVIDFDDAVTLETVTLNYERIKKEYTTKDEQINRQSQTITSQAQHADELETTISKQADNLTAQTQHIDALENKATEQSQTITSQVQHADELETTISKQADNLTAQTQHIDVLENKATEQSQTITSQAQHADELENTISKQADNLTAQTQHIDVLENKATEQSQTITSQAQHADELENTISKQADNLTAQTQHIDVLENKATEQSQTITSQAQHADELENTISEQADNLTAQTQHIDVLENKTTEQSQTITSQAQHADELDKQIFNRGIDIQSMRLINRVRRFFWLYKPAEFCRKELPSDFSKQFDSDGYLKANPDVAEAVKNKAIESALKHFADHGFDEIQRGDRKLLENLPFYDDEDYKSTRGDVTQAIGNGDFKYSHFVHYLLFGHQEILKQQKLKMAKKIRSDLELFKKDKTITSHFSEIKEKPIKPTHPVAVILPVYRGVEMTKRCILAAMPDVLSLKNSKLVAINDASPDSGMQEMLEGLVEQWPEVFYVLKNDKNLGFVQTVNRGFDYFQQYDAVLLNSDVIVPVDWLSRLRNEAYLRDKIGTVTPFSNNATICSFPYFLQENKQAFSLDVNEIDAVFKENRQACVTAPTGVGFCMYIRRKCLDEIGNLNFEKFGRGYGEENDLCQRAIKKGWLNILSPNIYAFHEGGVSFSSDKQALVDKAMGVIEGLHPNYHHDVRQFVEEEPLKFARVTRHLQLLSKTAIPKVIHVSHALGGGVVQHIEELAEFHDKSSAHLILSPYDGLNDVSISLGVSPHADTLVFNIPSDYKGMVGLLKTIGISAIHYHHTINLNHKIFDLAADLAVPHIVTVHDYYWLNANPTLTDESGVYPGYYEDKIQNPMYPMPEGVSLEEFRKPIYKLLRGAKKVVFPSNATKEIFSSVYSLDNAVVVRHLESGRDIDKESVNFIKKDKYTIGVLGALSKEKGADLLEDLAMIAAKEKLPFKFQLLGYAYRPLKKIDTTGAYSQSQLPHLLQQHDVDMILFPARWPETYSYTLSYALDSGLPIIAPNIGAFPERLSDRKNSLIFNYQISATELINQLTIFIEGITDDLDIKAPAIEEEIRINNFYEKDYIKILLATKKNTMIGKNYITIKEKWVKKNQASSNTRKERVLSIIWSAYMHPSTYWLSRLIPSSSKRKVRRFLSDKPIHNVIKEGRK